MILPSIINNNYNYPPLAILCGPFPSSGLLMCQNESSCNTFHMKMIFICMKMDV